MEQLILHLIGDYILQNSWQALNKKKDGWIGFWACLTHCIIYSLPFLFIGSLDAVLFIFTTHFIIDRTNLVAYLIAFRDGVKIKDYQPGSKIDPVVIYNYKQYDISNFGFPQERPIIISVWLYIIVDNIFHVLFNYIAIRYM